MAFRLVSPLGLGQLVGGSRKGDLIFAAVFYLPKGLMVGCPGSCLAMASLPLRSWPWWAYGLSKILFLLLGQVCSDRPLCCFDPNRLRQGLGALSPARRGAMRRWSVCSAGTGGFDCHNSKAAMAPGLLCFDLDLAHPVQPQPKKLRSFSAAPPVPPRGSAPWPRLHIYRRRCGCRRHTPRCCGRGCRPS